MPNSFSDLNDYSNSTGLEFTDNRPAKVIFDRPVSLISDRQLDIVSTSVIVDPTIEIEEVINYSVANVRYVVEIKSSSVNPLTGSSITWPVAPNGTIISHINDTYTVTGIHSKDDWDVLRSFVWNLPADYASKKLWFLRVSVVYFDEATMSDVSVSWNSYDPDFYYFATLEATSSLAIPGQKRIRTITQQLTSSFGFVTDWGTEKRIQANINSEFSVFCSGDDRSFANANLKNYAAVSLVPSRKRPMVYKNLPAVSTLTFGNNVIIIKQISNFIGVNRNWLSNQANQIFSTNTPNFNDDNVTGANYAITISVGSGTIGTSVASSSSYQFVGTKAEVNAVFANIYYYPNKGSSTSTTMTISETRNGVVLPSFTVNLTYAGAGAIPTTIYTLQGTTVKDTNPLYEVMTWSPTLLEQKYGKFDCILIGGGARGSIGSYGYTVVTKGKGGNGGGAGTYTLIENQSFTQTTYTFNVGTTGYLGGTTTGLGYSAAGGYSGSYTGKLGESARGYTFGARGGDPEDGSSGGGDAGPGLDSLGGLAGAGGPASLLPFGGYAGGGGGAGNGYVYGGSTNNGRRGTTPSYPGSGGGGGGGYGGPAPGGGGGVGEYQPANGIPGAVIIRTYS